MHSSSPLLSGHLRCIPLSLSPFIFGSMYNSLYLKYKNIIAFGLMESHNAYIYFPGYLTRVDDIFTHHVHISRLYILGIHLFRKHASPLWPSVFNRSKRCYRAARDASCRKDASFSYSTCLSPAHWTTCLLFIAETKRAMYLASDTAVAICEPARLFSRAFSGISWCMTMLHSAGCTGLSVNGKRFENANFQISNLALSSMMSNSNCQNACNEKMSRRRRVEASRDWDLDLSINRWESNPVMNIEPNWIFRGHRLYIDRASTSIMSV